MRFPAEEFGIRKGISEMRAIYIYEYLYVTNINQISDFYVFAEVQRDVDGVQARTGNFFAVDVYLGTRYKLYQSNYGRYSLEAIDNVEEQGF